MEDSLSIKEQLFNLGIKITNGAGATSYFSGTGYYIIEWFNMVKIDDWLQRISVFFGIIWVFTKIYDWGIGKYKGYKKRKRNEKDFDLSNKS